jgi:hypothetical protein
MKGKIDKKGHLWIERGGKMKEKYCMYNSLGDNCADYCPLFGEPEEHDDEDWNPTTERYEPNGKKYVKITLCHRTLVFNELTDERAK